VSTLSRYVVSRFLHAFLGALVTLALAVMVVDMLLNLDEMLQGGAGVAGAVRYLWLRLASVYLPYLIPVATFAGALFAIGVLARNHEIIAMKAGGVAPIVALIPIFSASAVIAIGALVADETFTVRAASALASQPGVPAGQVELRGGTIWYHTGRYIYNIRSPDPTGETVRDIRVYERDADGRLVRLIQATRAQRMAPREWRFEGATVRLFDPSKPDAAPKLERSREVTLRLEEDRSPRLLQAEISALPIWTLSRYVRASPGDLRARSVLHQRLTGPLLVLLFALLAVPLGLRVEQTRSLALPALQGVLVLFAFLLAREYGASFTAGGALGAFAPWAVLLAFAAFGGVQLARAES
jgi:lipopolysaccharide export system permease protein